MKTIKIDPELVKEHLQMSEKKKQTLYCMVVVIGLILLTFGDQIMMHFISRQPNPNNTLFGGTEDSGNYDIDFLRQLSIREVINKIENKDTFILLSTRESCYMCQKYLKVLKSEFLTNNIQGYYINRSLYDRDNRDYEDFILTDERLAKNLQYTPYLIYYQTGVLQSELVGNQKNTVLVQFIHDNELSGLNY